MFISVKSNVRTAAAARRSLVEAVQVAMRGGAVSGFLVVALSLLGVSVDLRHLRRASTIPQQAPFLIVGFGFGASFVALFAQLGGGIYTKAADVGSDLVGKVEAGIPEDDPRNAGVIADLVGDNVGDCAGRGADLFESTAAENIGAMILGVGVYCHRAAAGWPNPEAWIFFPLVVRAFGLIATIISVAFFIRGREDENPMNILNRGYWATTSCRAIGLAFTTDVMMQTSGVNGASGIPAWIWFFLAGLVGLATSIAFVYITQYYTAGAYRPVQEIAEASKTGPATNIITGIAVGFETTAVTAIDDRHRALREPLARPAGRTSSTSDGRNVGGIFGTAVATMGMLMTTAYVLAMDTFGPITDNAGGIAEFSRSEASAREITDRLDAVGNTTKALTKGYAIASASLAAFLLFSRLHRQGQPDPRPPDRRRQGGRRPPDLGQPGQRQRVRRGPHRRDARLPLQLARDPRGRHDGAGDHRRGPPPVPGDARDHGLHASGRTTRASSTSRHAPHSREMVLPGVVAVATPIIVGLLLGYEAVAGLLMVGTIAGVLLATVLNNGGGAWDNAKKYIEAGHLNDDAGNVLGKKTDAHAAAVVGDTVGDPFKDTAGPSLHVLVKLLATITLVLAPLFIR